MASLESLKIAHQATDILSNVRRDIRESCTDHKGRLDRNEWTAAFVRTEVNRQGTALLAVLQRIADHQSAVEAALLEWEVPVEDTQAEYMLLRDAAIAMRDATAGNVSATLTQILAQVPAKVRLF